MKMDSVVRAEATFHLVFADHRLIEWLYGINTQSAGNTEIMMKPLF